VQLTTLTTTGDDGLHRGVRSALDGADEALLRVAFVQNAGVHQLRGRLEPLGLCARLMHTTAFTECSTALGMARELGAQVGILNPPSGTYHPKVYLARQGGELRVVVGSANLTGGLVNNVEAAVMLRGTAADEPIRTAWEFGESLWADPRRSVWSRVDEGAPDEETFPPELYAQLVAAVAANQQAFLTLGPTPKRNLVHEVTPAGPYVETDASRAKGNLPQLIPAWMFTLAWDYLRTHGQLSNRYLLATEGLNVKRSSAVCAILARLQGVEYTSSRSCAAWSAAGKIPLVRQPCPNCLGDATTPLGVGPALRNRDRAIYDIFRRGRRSRVLRARRPSARLTRREAAELPSWPAPAAN
jgi:hypothetical protein